MESLHDVLLTAKDGCSIFQILL